MATERAYAGSVSSAPEYLDRLTRVIPDFPEPGILFRDLTPVFSFNSEGLWQGVNGNSAGDPLARLSRWREVLAKARAEGF